MNAIRSIALLLVACFSISGCDSNDNRNRQAGICYCEFFSGDESEYDLTDLDREAQETQCRIHDTNAEHFGGHCELE